MQDLTSQVYPDGPIAALVPSSQHAGNRPTDQRAARSAPGTPSPAVDVGDITQPPFASAIDHQRTTVTNGQEPPPASRFTGPDSSGWGESDATDILRRRRDGPG